MVKNVLSDAKWIWTETVHTNSYVGASRRIELPGSVKSAKITLFADAMYKLHVNGRFVNAGPTPFRKPVLMADSYDITAQLRAGENEVFILGHFFGVDMAYNMVERPGIIARIDVVEANGASRSFVTDDQWTVYPIEAWTQETARKTFCLGYVEDLHLEHPSYRVLEHFAAEDYAGDRPVSPKELEALGQRPQTYQRDDLQISARMVPNLRWDTETPRDVAKIFRTVTDIDNFRDNSIRLDLEHLEPAWDNDKYNILKGEFPTLRRRPGERAYSMVYDLRRMSAGDISLEVHVDAPCTFDVVYVEQLRYDRPYISRGGSQYYARFHLRAGTNRFRMFHYSGYRYIYLVMKDFVGSLEIRRITNHECRADLAFAETITTNDRRAWHLYDISRRSLMLNSQAGLYDCNTREQRPFWGDAIWIAETAAHLTGDYRHLKHMCYSMTSEYNALGTLNGNLFGVGAPLQDYVLIAVQTLARYHDCTADDQTLRDNIAAAQNIVRDFRACRDESGFVLSSTYTKHNAACANSLLFLDHPGLNWHTCATTPHDRSDYNAGLNLFYLQALQALQRMQSRLVMADDLSSEIETLKRCIADFFFIPEMGLITDARSEGKTSFTYSQIVNAMAITTGVLTGDAARYALAQVLDVARNPFVSQGTPYTYFYLIDAAVQTGMVPAGLEALKDAYANMLKSGATTTWESWTAERHDSLNHAWSAVLPLLMVRGVAGATSLEPGFRRLHLAPCLEAFDDLEFAFHVPTGKVKVAWHKVGPREYEFSAEVPSGLDTTLELGGKRETLTGTIQKRVTI